MPRKSWEFQHSTSKRLQFRWCLVTGRGFLTGERSASLMSAPSRATELPALGLWLRLGYLPKSVLGFLPRWQNSNGPEFQGSRAPTLFPFHCCLSVPVRPNVWVSELPYEGKLSSRIYTELLCKPAVKNSVVFDHVHGGLAGPNSYTTFSSTAGNKLWMTVYSTVQPQ